MQGKKRKKTTNKKLDLSYALLMRYAFHEEIFGLIRGRKTLQNRPDTPGAFH